MLRAGALVATGEPARTCAWCGRAFETRDARLTGRRACGGCGSQTTDPVPSEAELDRAYADWYRPESGRFSGPLDALLARSRASLASRLDEIAPPGPILDVGSGDGTLVRALAARGREAVGIERAGEDPVDGGGPWSAVVFWHSLEHLPRAREALARAASEVSRGGVVVIAMPNPESLQARAFGDAWLALDLPRHLVHVPARALVAGLRESGLNLERRSDLRGGQVLFGWLHGLVGLLPGAPDLYDAIRRPEARSRPLSRSKRALALAAAVVLAPVACAAAAFEVAIGRGGSVYVEARRG